MTKKTVLVIKSGCTAVPELHVEERDDAEGAVVVCDSDDEDELENDEEGEITYESAMPEIHATKLHKHS